MTGGDADERTAAPEPGRRLGLPLLCRTPPAWARLAAADLPRFLADHAVCEQHAALSALNLVAHYADDDELVQALSALAAEEVSHLRRVARLLHGRGLHLARRRPNPYVQGLRRHITATGEPELKVDRLLVGALIEARSCERFGLLADAVDDRALAGFYAGLRASEARHHRTYVALAERVLPAAAVRARLAALAGHEARVLAEAPAWARLHT